MGEILRAIMEKNCIYSQSAFFTLPLTLVTSGAPPSIGRRQASARWKTDSWFLILGWAQFTAFQNVGLFGWASRMEPATFVLQKGNNLEQFEFNGPAPKVNHNDTLNNFVSLSEYPLLEPGELLTVIEDVQVTNTGSPFTRTTYLTMQGVEFQMPPNKGVF
jgi:hypothetical protein